MSLMLNTISDPLSRGWKRRFKGGRYAKSERQRDRDFQRLEHENWKQHVYGYTSDAELEELGLVQVHEWQTAPDWPIPDSMQQAVEKEEKAQNRWRKKNVLCLCPEEDVPRGKAYDFFHGSLATRATQIERLEVDFS